jgi:hypothetical protein
VYESQHDATHGCLVASSLFVNGAGMLVSQAVGREAECLLGSASLAHEYWVCDLILSRFCPRLADNISFTLPAATSRTRPITGMFTVCPVFA